MSQKSETRHLQVPHSGSGVKVELPTGAFMMEDSRPFGFWVAQKTLIRGLLGGQGRESPTVER